MASQDNILKKKSVLSNDGVITINIGSIEYIISPCDYQIDISINLKSLRKNDQTINDITISGCGFCIISKKNCLEKVNDTKKDDSKKIIDEILKKHFIEIEEICDGFKKKITDLTDAVNKMKVTEQQLYQNSITYKKKDDIMQVRSYHSDISIINLSDNYIVSIIKIDFPKVIEINLNMNNLSSLNELGTLHNLMTLSVNNNLLTEISGIRNLTLLKKLNLEFNKITEFGDIPFLVNLENINLRHNYITVIADISALLNLTNLNLSSNKITLIPDEILKLSLLIDLRYNPVNRNFPRILLDYL